MSIARNKEMQKISSILPYKSGEIPIVIPDTTLGKMDLWNKVARPHKEALKQIKGGRLSGMTDINPQWRYKAMTEQFGQCGIAWGYKIIKLWQEPLADGEILAFAHVEVWAGSLGHVTPGIGGSKLVAKERDGLRSNDEAYKMAVTDALSVALKMLGVGADIYLNLYDGSKYRDEEHPNNPISSPILPTDDFAANHAEEPTIGEELLLDLSGRLVMLFHRDDISGLQSEYDAANLSNRDKGALWALLKDQSSVRRAIKQRGEHGV